MLIVHQRFVNEDLDAVQDTFFVSPDLADRILAWVDAQGWPDDQWLVQRSPTKHNIGIGLVRRYSLEDDADRELAHAQIARLQDQWQNDPAIEWQIRDV